MLAKCAEEQWHKDPNAEIFIERDGEIFRHVLSYLRDGKVSLPPIVTKASLLADLQYYGIENIQEDKMDDTLVTGCLFMKSKIACIQVMQKLQREEKILKKCIQLFNIIHTCKLEDILVDGNYVIVSHSQHLTGCCQKETLDECNKYFKEFGYHFIFSTSSKTKMELLN
jgi:hypothetical protein